MLYYFVATLYVLAALMLIVVVLLQQGKGGDIANAFDYVGVLAVELQEGPILH